MTSQPVTATPTRPNPNADPLKPEKPITKRSTKRKGAWKGAVVPEALRWQLACVDERNKARTDGREALEVQRGLWDA